MNVCVLGFWLFKVFNNSVLFELECLLMSILLFFDIFRDLVCKSVGVLLIVDLFLLFGKWGCGVFMLKILRLLVVSNILCFDE